MTRASMDDAPRVADQASLLDGPGGAVWEAHAAEAFPGHPCFPEDLRHATPTAQVPAWMIDGSGWIAPAVRFMRVHDAAIWLHEGAVMNGPGHLVAESAVTLAEARPDLTVFPGAQSKDGRAVFDPAVLRGAAAIEAPVLVAAHGWTRSFGHWLFDTLSSVVTFMAPIRAGRLRLLMPELADWQRRWLAAIGVPADAIIERGFGLVVARDAIVASTLSIQNVRWPGAHVATLVALLRTLVPPPPAEPPRLLYLSRRGALSHRTLDGEEELAAALAGLGFASVAPEALAPAEQLRLFASAQVMIGPVGSAFALCGLAPRGAAAVEILPPPAAHSWIHRTTAICGQRYGCVMADVLAGSARDGEIFGRVRPGWFYRYRADRDAVLRVAERALRRAG